MEQSQEDKAEVVAPQSASQSYAATVALPSTPPSSTTLLGTVLLCFKYGFPCCDASSEALN